VGHEEYDQHGPRRPLKDGYYDHGQNCVEYIVLKFGPTAPTKKQTKAAAEWAPQSRYHGPDAWMSW
jgi:hypothetical protein